MNISQILTKLKSLVYSKSEVDTLLSSKASSLHTHTKSAITDFPTIPSKTSQLTNDSGFLTSHQSLSNYVDKSSNQAISGNKTFNDRTIFKKGSYIHSFGSSADVGYIKFATITNDTGAEYQDSTATLVMMNRLYLKPVCVYIKFKSAANADPDINVFATDATDNYANEYYIVKADTSTWDVYVYKTQWNSFTVLDFWQSQTNATNLTFTWKSEFVSSLPEGNIKATFMAYNYNHLSNRPTIPTVNNATLTIQKNSSNVATFTANASSNVTANISVPTKTSQLTNDSGFLTAHQSLSNYLAKYTNVSEMGRYIDLHYDNATAARDYDVRLYADSQGSSNGGGSFKISSASVYTPNNLYLGSYRVYVG